MNILNNFSVSLGNFVGGAYNHSIEGNWTMSGGTFNSTGTTVSFNGARIQKISTIAPFNNVNVSKASGVLMLESSITVNSILTFSKGVVRTDTCKVIIPSSGSIAGSAPGTGWVYGKLQKNFASGSNVTRSFELGDSLNYIPLSVTFATASTSGNLIASAKDQEHPNILSSPINAQKNVNRYWTLANEGIAFTGASVIFNWIASDQDAGIVPTNMKVAQYTGAWSFTAVNNITATSVQATGFSSFGDFVIGEGCVPGTWTGTVNTDWNLPANWQCGNLPDGATNVVIPSGLPAYPVISSGIVVCNNLTFQAGAGITITNSTLQIAGAITTSNGRITATTGKVVFNGTSPQTIPADVFLANTVKDLVITNPAGVTLSGPLSVTNSVGFGNVNNSTLKSNGYLTLVSTAANTASLLDVTNGGQNTGNTVSGDVTVERNMRAKRSYRFLTAPVNSTTNIRANWMEGVNNPTAFENKNPAPGYGTITGSGGDSNGFDATQTNNPSLFTFNNASQTWVPVNSSRSLFVAGNAYRIAIRGNRSVDLNNNLSPASVTTLRASGNLVTGAVTMTKDAASATAGTSLLSTLIGGYSFVANPYASAIDWLQLERRDITSTFYIYDPAISGSNGRGQYVSYNAIYKVASTANSSVSNDIQSGQAFFVQTSGPNPSLIFREHHKYAGPGRFSVQLLVLSQIYPYNYC